MAALTTCQLASGIYCRVLLPVPYFLQSVKQQHGAGAKYAFNFFGKCMYMYVRIDTYTYMKI